MWGLSRVSFAKHPHPSSLIRHPSVHFVFLYWALLQSMDPHLGAPWFEKDTRNEDHPAEVSQRPLHRAPRRILTLLKVFWRA